MMNHLSLHLLLEASKALSMHILAESCFYASVLILLSVILANNAVLFTHVHFLTFPELLHCCAHRISSAKRVTTVTTTQECGRGHSAF